MGNILIADDDKTCRDSMRRVLERDGHVVWVAEDVDRALGELDVVSFDLIVCDYRMPGKTGIDFLVELEKLRSRVPVLMISAYADAATTDTALQLGALAVLNKPVRRKELIARAAEAMGRAAGACVL